MAALVRQAVMGILNQRAAYGYAIGQRLPYLVGSRPHVVYGVLDSLHRAGDVVPAGEKTIGATERGAPRVMYALTEQGSESFRSWMRRVPARTRLHDELGLKLALAQPHDLPRLLAMAQQQRVECLDEQLEYSRAPLIPPSEDQAPWSHVATLLAERRVAIQLQADVKWLDLVCAELERRATASGL